MTARTPRFAVLGPLEVTLPDGSPVSPGGPKQRELLALLLLQRGRPVPPDRLVADLWGEDAPPGAAATLRSHVAHLRRRLAGTVLADALATGPAGYALSVAGAEVDADRFEQLLGLAQEAWGLGRPQRAGDLVAEALGLWRGRPWADREGVASATADAARLEDLRRVAWELRGEVDLTLGHHGEIVGRLEALVVEHPFHERFWAQLIRALYRSGRQADALTAFEEVRSALDEELGLAPGPELQQLHLAVLRQDPVLLGDAPAHRVPTAVQTAAARRGRDQVSDGVLMAVLGHPLVGRDVELSRLLAAWRRAAEGEPVVFLLSGEAGIGKTRLVAELAREVTSGQGLLLVGRCADPESPYHAVADALRHAEDVERASAEAPEAVRSALDFLLGDGPATVGPTSGRDPRPALYAAVRALLTRCTEDGPVLLVVEEAERLDRASALLLQDLVRRLPPGLSLALSYRDPPGGRHPPLGALLGDAALDRLAERFSLAPLDEASVGALVERWWPGTTPEVATRLWRHTGGNPYFATELARSGASRTAHGEAESLSWPLPTGVREALRQRLATLSPPTRGVLTAAGVLGAQVDFDVLAEVVSSEEDALVDALGEAVAAGFLVESGESWVGSYGFPHELMREATRLEVPAPQLRRLHLRAARAWERRLGDGGRGSARVAHHLRAAGRAVDPAETAKWCQAAAREAERLFAWDEALEHADAAAALLDAERPGPESAKAAVQAATVRLRASREYDRVVTLLESALQVYVEAGALAEAGHVHGRLGGALVMHHGAMDVPRALEHLRAAERLVPEAVEAFHLQRGRAQAGMLGVRTALLADAGERAAAIAAAAGRRDLTVTARWAQGWAAFNAGRLGEADELVEEAWQLSHELADPLLGWIAVQAPAVRANLYLLDPSRARDWCRRGLGQPRLRTLAHSHSTVVDLLGCAMALQGDLGSAEEATRALPGSPVARRLLGLLGGRWEEAAAAFGAAAEGDEASGDRNDAAVNHRLRAWALRLTGDAGAAVAALERALEIATSGPQVPTEVAARAELARLVAPDDPDLAVGHLQRCEQLMAGEDWRGLAGVVSLGRLALAGAVGDRAGVEGAGSEAVRVFTQLRLPWHRADALGAWAERLAAFDGTAAARRRGEALATYQDLGVAGRWSDLRAPTG